MPLEDAPAGLAGRQEQEEGEGTGAWKTEAKDSCSLGCGPFFQPAPHTCLPLPGTY